MQEIHLHSALFVYIFHSSNTATLLSVRSSTPIGYTQYPSLTMRAALNCCNFSLYLYHQLLKHEWHLTAQKQPMTDLDPRHWVHFQLDEGSLWQICEIYELHMHSSFWDMTRYQSHMGRLLLLLLIWRHCGNQWDAQEHYLECILAADNLRNWICFFPFLLGAHTKLADSSCNSPTAQLYWYWYWPDL